MSLEVHERERETSDFFFALSPSVAGAAGAAARHTMLRHAGGARTPRTAPMVSKLAKGAAVGAALGGTQFPLGRYWVRRAGRGGAPVENHDLCMFLERAARPVERVLYDSSPMKG